MSEISDLIFFVSNFASQSKRIKFGDYVFDVCCANKTFWLDVRHPQQAVAREYAKPQKNIGLSLRPQLFLFFYPKPQTLTNTLNQTQNLSPNHQFSQRIFDT